MKRNRRITPADREACRQAQELVMATYGRPCFVCGKRLWPPRVVCDGHGDIPKNVAGRHYPRAELIQYGLEGYDG